MITEPVSTVLKPAAPSDAGEPPIVVKNPILSLKPVAVRRTGSVEIEFELGVQGPTTLAVFDVAGRRVRTLVDGGLSRGDHRCSWDGRNDHGLQVAHGIYFVVLKSHETSARAKIPMLR